jgi:hypothetical protein
LLRVYLIISALKPAISKQQERVLSSCNQVSPVSYRKEAFI